MDVLHTVDTGKCKDEWPPSRNSVNAATQKQKQDQKFRQAHRSAGDGGETMPLQPPRRKESISYEKWWATKVPRVLQLGGKGRIPSWSRVLLYT